MYSKLTILLLLLFTFGQFSNIQKASALPIDWNGQFGFDTNLLKDVRKTTDDCSQADDSYCVGNDEDNARYQSYIFKLKPTIVVNDSATIKGEISTGSIRGGFTGEDTQGGTSYFAQSPSGASTLTFNQLYAELYADTALFKVGKFSKHFGLGAVISGGSGVWDRYFSVYNGLEATFNLGKFSIAPVFAKIQTPAPADSANPHSGKYDANETGIVASYNDPNSNFDFSAYYAVRSVETDSELYGADADSSEVTIIDIYFRKAWEKFSIAMEIPMLSGEAGRTYGGASASEDLDIESKAFILETAYQANEKWKLGLNAGMVGGEDGSDEFSGMFLHPNYKIGELMFAYNYRGFQDGSDIFNGSVTNATFAKLYANYKSEAWTWKLALIMAKANEAASEGEAFYNQDTNKFANANFDQDDDLGMEADIAFDYQWNPSILVSGYLAYWQTGDFYGFTNTAQELEVADVTATGMSLSLSF